MSAQNGAGGEVGLVLGGGGARGAYTSGVLSVLLPELKDQVRVIVGRQIRRDQRPRARRYYDGGSRLNTPIKPALWLGAKRVIVIALNSVAPSRTAAPEEQPDFYVGAAHLLHAALGDPLAQDIRTLANTNALIAAGLAAANGRSRHHRPAARKRLPGGLVEPVQFAEELIGLGQADARRWIDEHPAGLWQLDPPPDWNQAPNGDPDALNSPRPARTRPSAGEREPATVTREGSNGAAA